MKKIIFLALIAAALGFTACSSEDETIVAEKPQRGMVLNASVEQSAKTRAIIDNTGDNSTSWSFAFAAGDEVRVTNPLYDGYYTFIKNATNFKSEDAEPTATSTTWYAYFPSETIDLTGQDGSLACVANKFALAGATASEVTGENGLSIAMEAQVAIIKIINYKGSISIRAMKLPNDVTGLTAKSGEAGFEIQTNVREVPLFSTSTPGTYYIAVPAGVQLNILDGNKSLKTTSSEGLTAGKYYELTIPKPNLLPGDFSVSAKKKVKFTKSNVYWNASESAFHFEDNPTDFPTGSFNADHVGHFFWASALENSVQETTGGFQFTYDVLQWCKNLFVDGIDNLYTLSRDEWAYLVYNREGAANKIKNQVTVNGVGGCLVIAPDDFTGTIASNYTLEGLNADGLVCLPPSSGPVDPGNYGSYWTNTAHVDIKEFAYRFYFSPKEIKIPDYHYRSFKSCIRLVQY